MGMENSFSEAFEDAIAQSANREKRESIYLAARLEFEGLDAPVETRVRNLSAGGMMVDCAIRVPIGHRVTVHFKNLGATAAKVAWASATHLGIAFDRPINPDLLRPVKAAPASTSGPVRAKSALPDIPQPAAQRLGKDNRRSKRRNIFLAAQVGKAPDNREKVTVRVRDVSSSGAQLDAVPSYAEGDQLLVELGSLGLLPARVVRLANGRMGVAFDFEIDPDSIKPAR